MATVEIIICTHNRLALLRKCLSSIEAAAKPVDLGIGVTVVANACTDGTEELLLSEAQSLFPSLTIKLLQEPTPGKSRALNLAIGQLRSDWAFFTDDDQRVRQDFLVTLAKLLSGGEDRAIVCGRLLPDWDGTEPSWVHDQGPYRIFPPPITEYDIGDQSITVTSGLELPGGGNLVVPRQVFDVVGKFSTELGPKGHDLVGSEDTDFLMRAMKRGIAIHYRPKLVQYHYVDHQRLKIGYLMQKAYQRSRSITAQESPGKQGIPRYFWKKLAIYAFNTVFSCKAAKTRYYLVRLAATLGEMIGLSAGSAK